MNVSKGGTERNWNGLPLISYKFPFLNFLFSERTDS